MHSFSKIALLSYCASVLVALPAPQGQDITQSIFNWSILGWQVDAAKDQLVRSRSSSYQYSPSCPTGFSLKDGSCVWDPPRVLVAKNSACPTGYIFNQFENRCYWGNLIDPFYNFQAEGKWWQVDTGKDYEYRKQRGFRFYDSTCQLGYGRLNNVCVWFAPIILKPIDYTCPSTFQLIGNYCQWKGDQSQDVFLDKISLAAMEAKTPGIKVPGIISTIDSLVQTPISVHPIAFDPYRKQFNTQQYTCSGTRTFLRQGESISIKIMNDLQNNKWLDLCTFDEFGNSYYAGHTFGPNELGFTFQTHTGKSYQLRLVSALGRCRGGIVSKSIRFAKCDEGISLSTMMSACL